MLRYRLARPWLIAARTLRLLGLSPGAGAFRILLLHHVGDERFAVLEEFVDYVKRVHGVLSPDQAGARLSGGGADGGADGGAAKAGRLPCLFTFDDGFASNHRVASHILDKHGVKALFFVCPGLVGLEGAERRSPIADSGLAEDVPLMTWEEIADLKAGGHAVGAHAMTHRRLSRLGKEEMRREIVESGHRLGERLGGQVSWFAYPFGDIDSISRDALEIISQEFRFCRSGVRGTNAPGTDPRALRADHIDLAAPPAYRQLVLEGGLDMGYAGARRRLDAMAAR